MMAKEEGILVKYGYSNPERLKPIILFGSYTGDSYTIRSEIDICLAAGKRNVKEILNMFLTGGVT